MAETCEKVFHPQMVGRKWALLSRILNPGTVKAHELSRATYQPRAREIISDDVRSGIFTYMFLLNTSKHTFTSVFHRLPDYAAVRSEIETSLEAQQSSTNPDASDIGSLFGQKGVCRICGQRGHWAAECPTRGKAGQGDKKGGDGKGQGKKGEAGKGKN